MTETIQGMENLSEGEGANKKLFIEGVFAQAELKNRNKRIYPLAILEREVNKYQNLIEDNRATGELSHPNSPDINPDRISHKVVSLQKEGNDFIGKALITNTPCGNIVKGLHEADIKIGVSTRALGSVKMKNGINEVQDDLDLRAIDIVTNPSAIDAFVEGLMENATWVPKSQENEDLKQVIKETKLIDLQKRKFEVWNKFFRALINT